MVGGGDAWKMVVCLVNSGKRWWFVEGKFSTLIN